RKTIYLDGENLDIDTVVEISNHPDQFQVAISEESIKKMKIARDYVLNIANNDEAVYGINTGFGALSEERIDRDDLSELQINLIRSHCTGVGRPMDDNIVRAIMILRANCLVSGHSGVSLEAVERLNDFINFNITPVVPSKGSVGASGDLAPLSHIALGLIGEGEVKYEGKIVNSQFALDQIKKKPVKLGPKDGLALINGTAAMLAHGCHAVYEARKLAKMADVISCMTLEGLRGTSKAYSPLISSLKPHVGQLNVCSNLNRLLEESQINESHEDCGKVQDPYSLRCVPQVHGSCRQTINHAAEIVAVEINSVTDNPLIFVEQDEVLSGGNFHGEALAFCMDYLAMGLAEFCSISERRVEKMMDPHFSDLPSFLTTRSGLNSGLMIAHVTAAALTSENKILCHPASVDSVPTSTDKEDHVSMGLTSGRKVWEIIYNLKNVLAIELLANSQAIDFLRPLKSSKSIEAVHKLIRKHVPIIEKDRVFYKDIKSIRNLIDSGEIIKTIEEEIGELL
ncbi:MAG: histidine ammonia-lyase, partial [Bacteriovoracaceae bacterium]